MSNPMNGLVGNQSLLDAKKLLEQYKEGKEPEGTTREEVEKNCHLKNLGYLLKIKFLIVSGCKSHAAVQISLPPRLRRIAKCIWKNVFPGSRRNAHHRSHAPILQNNSSSGLLAVVQSVIQCSGQLHK